ncbi:uncharacterized protein LOC132387939 [Hypanus sabinus]|uniref:uncharacterized protein LOC132387939 n=1 Tax=Hypanus sabinus TaxID=79690 RepID=UPI0028C50F0F|nr:uncharacterized protein LOC132387939 [Hypanus sabinus]
MYLLVPEELWENPPTPTSPQAFITRFPTMDVLSRRIRWNAMTQANDFNRTLTEQNAKFNNSFFFVSFCKGKVRRSIRTPGNGFGQYSPLAGTAVFQLEGADEHTATEPPVATRLDRADEHTTTAPPVPTRLDRSGGRVTTASRRASRRGRKRKCNTSPPARRCKGPLLGQHSPFAGWAVFQLEGADEDTTTAPPVPTRLDRLRKRSIRTSAGALTSGERSFWGAEVSIGGVSYDFSSMPAGNEVWFVATGEMDCPLM